MSPFISRRVYRISSELRSQAASRLLSTEVGDHSGIGVNGDLSFFLLAVLLLGPSAPECACPSPGVFDWLVFLQVLQTSTSSSSGKPMPLHCLNKTLCPTSFRLLLWLALHEQVQREAPCQPVLPLPTLYVQSCVTYFLSGFSLASKNAE